MAYRIEYDEKERKGKRKESLRWQYLTAGILCAVIGIGALYYSKQCSQSLQQTGKALECFAEGIRSGESFGQAVKNFLEDTAAITYEEVS